MLLGLIIASVIKYADNILKTFANAASILRKPLVFKTPHTRKRENVTHLSPLRFFGDHHDGCCTAIAVSAFISFVFLGDFSPSWNFGAGAPLVFAATYMYGKPDGLSANALKLNQVSGELVGLRKDLREKDGEIEALKARLEAVGERV